MTVVTQIRAKASEAVRANQELLLLVASPSLVPMVAASFATDSVGDFNNRKFVQAAAKATVPLAVVLLAGAALVSAPLITLSAAAASFAALVLVTND